MFSPNREKIFEEIICDDKCSTLSCQQYRNHKGEHRCVASEHVECVITKNIASGINEFISKNEWQLSLILATKS